MEAKQIQRKEIRIEGFSLQIPKVQNQLKKRGIRNTRKIFLSTLAFFYSLLSIIISPSLGITESNIALISILLNILYYLIFILVSLRQKKKITKTISNLGPYSAFKCQSITIHLKDSGSIVNVKQLLLQDAGVNNLWLYLIGLALIIQFVCIQLTNPEEDSQDFLLKFLVIYSMHVLFLIYFMVSAAILKLASYSSHNDIKNPQNTNGQNIKQPTIVINLDQDCSICLSTLRESPSVSTYFCCNNSFHAECIQRWLNRRVNCPLCRSKVS